MNNLSSQSRVRELRAAHRHRPQALSTAQQNKVSITLDRHSGHLPAGIHKSFMDTG